MAFRACSDATAARIVSTHTKRWKYMAKSRKRRVIATKSQSTKYTGSEPPTKELSRWGWYCRDRIYEVSNKPSILAKLMEYGINVPSGYYTEHKIPNPGILQTQRVWAFMPRYVRQVVFVHYAMDGYEPDKAVRLGVTVETYYHLLREGIRFYSTYRNTDFSALDESVPRETSTYRPRTNFMLGKVPI